MVIYGVNPPLAMALCQEYASLGYGVVMASPSHDNTFYSDIRSRYGVEIISYEIDLTHRDSACILFTYISDCYNDAIHEVINVGHIIGYNLSYNQHVLRLTNYFIEMMKDQGYGRIVNFTYEYSFSKLSRLNCDILLDLSQEIRIHYGSINIDATTVVISPILLHIYRDSQRCYNFWLKLGAIESPATIAHKVASSTNIDITPGWINRLSIWIERRPTYIADLVYRITYYLKGK